MSTNPGAIAARITERLKEEVGPQRYDRVFSSSTQLGVSAAQASDAPSLCVAVPSRFVADLIDRQFGQSLRRVANQELGDQAELRFEVDPERFPRQHDGKPAASANQVQAAAKPLAAPATKPRAAFRHRLKDFIIGDCNALAFSAAERVAMHATDPEANAPSPLFIHGHCGLGKTHLLQGLCQRARQLHPQAKVEYTTGERFTNDFIHAVRTQKLDAFRARLRGLNLLAIDDVQFIAAKEKTQQEFLHTFEQIELGGARVVLAGDTHPRQIQHFSDALVSRCLRGLVVEVAEPDETTRAKLVAELGRRQGLVFEPSAAERLAVCYPGSVRELQGAITKLHALATLDQRDATNPSPTMAIGHAWVDRLTRHDTAVAPVKPIRCSLILKEVADALAVPVEQVLGRSRHRHVVLARTLFCYLSHKLTSLSYPEIARSIERRNHSTIITAVQRFKKQLEHNEPVMTAVDADPVTPTALVDRLTARIRRAS